MSNQDAIDDAGDYLFRDMRNDGLLANKGSVDLAASRELMFLNLASDTARKLVLAMEGDNGGYFVCPDLQFFELATAIKDAQWFPPPSKIELMAAGEYEARLEYVDKFNLHKVDAILQDIFECPAGTGCDPDDESTTHLTEEWRKV